MNKFESLTIEKQNRIINAGLHQFSKYGYQKANTEDIAYEAQIAKGLLFYYFKNKEAFYLYLCDFCESYFIETFSKDIDNTITDFFDFIESTIISKVDIIKTYPYMFDFCMMLTLSSQKDNQKANDFLVKLMSQSYEESFRHIDFSKFKEEVDPMEILQMILWLSEGYLLDKQRLDQPITLEELLVNAQKWQLMFKTISYKEEFQ
ncbi:MAG: TetR/AcrR family transcriptional regulator [Erysipelothrix sp.]